MKPATPITVKEINALIRRWKRDLKLRDWDICAELSTMEELGDAYGECQPVLHNRTALIRLAVDMPREMLEQIVVHEMLHCHTAALPTINADAQRAAEEHLIWPVAALLAKWRPDPKPPKKRKADCPQSP